MADRSDNFLELATLTSEAIEEIGRLRKTAGLNTEDLQEISDVLENCGMLKSSEKETFIKTASDNPKSLVSAIKFIAGRANHNPVVTTDNAVGTIVKGASDNTEEIPDRDASYVALYESRKKFI